MQYPNNGQQGQIRMRRRRKVMIWLGEVLAVLLILIVVGAIFESNAEAADTKANPAPGKMVDVGGYRLHLNCTGTGSPTVLVESGWGDFSASWGWVQPEVAKTTRICTYDRAGMGWSDVSPNPRTAREFAKELHTLLVNANESGPYVLVGHSLGGYTMLVYAHDYPEEVTGLVLVDAQKLPPPDKAALKPSPTPGKNSLPSLLARIAVIRLLSGPLGSVKYLPKAEKQAYAALSVTPRSVQTFLDEGRGMSEGGAQARAVSTLGSLPLIVLSRGNDQDADWETSQVGFLQLSSNSQRIYAEKSGHEIMIEQPEAAVDAIVKMVELVRK